MKYKFINIVLNFSVSQPRYNFISTGLVSRVSQTQ